MKIKQQELSAILAKHTLWLDAEEGGERANLSGVNLSGANLSGAHGLNGRTFAGAIGTPHC